MSEDVKIIGLKNIPFIKKGDNIAQLIVEGCKKQNISLKDKDIILIAQTIITKSLGRIKHLENIKPSQKAFKIHNKVKPLAEQKKIPVKSPELIQAIIDESKKVLKTEHVIITETKQGFICANAGIDKSNIEGTSNIGLLPKNPDLEAKKIREHLYSLTNKRIGIIITDSFGRPFRNGAVGVALGVSGISPIKDKRGDQDLFGKTLESTIIGQADNLACAAQLIMGEANEGIPVVILRGYNYKFNKKANISSILRNAESDIFREETAQKIDKMLRARRSYKLNFSNQDVKEETIEKCVKLARWAPSAHNSQPWRYTILKKGLIRNNLINSMNEKLRTDLENDGRAEDYIRKKIDKTRTQFLNSPILILLSLDTSDLEKYTDEVRNQNEFILGVQSISASATYFLLALENEGLKACWYCAPLFSRDIVKDILGLPDSFIPMAFFTVGYPEKGEIKAPYRKKLQEIIFDLKKRKA
ncbi:MAG: coenzyme F420-0:L-glutamate ligase [Promethearchaeota archaeon]|nr:MAG: coenzyme F420-0:L-glutamate ligase [Candidatus Lokiarchaeota archaeon]